MGKFVSNRDETVRMFQNPVLEYFSHIHPATPLVVFMPVVCFFLYRAFETLNPFAAIGIYLAGILLWTLTEYGIHRIAFHYEPKTDLGKYLHFLVHGVHHDYPRDSTRLVMPLLVSVPLATVFYYAFGIIFGNYNPAVFAGFLTGYVAYDCIHYATHHMPMKGRIGNFLKVYHLKHHYGDDLSAFGVSNPLWDYVFGTVPNELPKRREERETEKKNLSEKEFA